MEQCAQCPPLASAHVTITHTLSYTGIHDIHMHVPCMHNYIICTNITESTHTFEIACIFLLLNKMCIAIVFPCQDLTFHDISD